MTDVASRPRRRGFWLCGLGSLAAVLIFAAARNWGFVEAGLLDPDFRVIHEAYDFNFGILPWVLFAMAGCFLALAWTWPTHRGGLFGFALLYGFFGGDLLVLRYYVTHVEPERLVVRRVRIETPKLSRPFRIVHLSDIQAGAIGTYERRIFRTVAAEEPDLVLNTGDFLQEVAPATFESELPKLVSLMRRHPVPHGYFGVFGDTELELYRVDDATLAPLKMLSSRAATVSFGGGRISVHGLSLFQSQNSEWASRSVDRWLEASDPSAFRILMGHSPNFALGFREHAIDLCLAGHTHGGQVRLPSYGPLVIDSEVPRTWARGFRRIGQPFLNVSAGAGSNRCEGLPPIRLNCPTELTVIDLVPLGQSENDDP